MAKKIACMACDEKVLAGELAFNEAEHAMNICSSCADSATAEVKKMKIAKFIEKGLDRKAAKAKVEALNLEKPVLKLIAELIEADEDVESELDEDIEIDEVEEEVEARKPRKAKTEKEVVKPAKEEKAAKPVKESKEEKAARLEKEARAARRAERKAKKEKAAEVEAKPARKSRKEKVEEVKPERKSRKEKVAPASMITVEIDPDSFSRFIRTAVKAAKADPTVVKSRKDKASVFTDVANAEFEALVADKLVRMFKSSAREAGLYSELRKAVKAAASTLE